MSISSTHRFFFLLALFTASLVFFTDVAHGSTTRAWGYAWAQQATGTFVASPSFSRNSSGDIQGAGVDNTITHLGAGRYMVTFPNLGNDTGGNVQVTSYGQTQTRCKVESWDNLFSTLRVFVGCRAIIGAPLDSQFTVSYVREFGSGTGDGGYLWANDPTSASYTPNATFQWNSTGALNQVERQGVGEYEAIFPGQSFFGGTVQVTAYGQGAQHCKVESWAPDGSDTRVRILCFNSLGAPTDSQFSLNLSQHYPTLALAYSYVWANQPITASYTPFAPYQRGFIAGQAGGDVAESITIERDGVGDYDVNLPRMTPSGSTVTATAYGTGPASCRIGGWTSSADGVRANVLCFGSNGFPSDSRFVLVYTDDHFAF